MVVAYLSIFSCFSSLTVLKSDTAAIVNGISPDSLMNYNIYQTDVVVTLSY